MSCWRLGIDRGASAVLPLHDVLAVILKTGKIARFDIHHACRQRRFRVKLSAIH